MGKIKLTLSIDDALIMQAKAFAKSKNQSLSKTIEDYISSFTSVKVNVDEINSEAEKLRGVAKSILSSKTDKEIKEMMYLDKHGV